MINVSNLSFARGNSLVFKNINLSILSSDIFLIKGSNGKGKSTLLSCISGFLEPLSGSIEYYKDQNIQLDALTYKDVPSLSSEEIEMLEELRPKNLDEASKISGMTPNTLLQILRYKKISPENLDHSIASENLIFIGEEDFAYEDLTIIENIYYWLSLNGVSPNNQAIMRSIKYLYGELNIDRKFLNLSFGQKRKMRMLLLMLVDKKIWILDDPFSGLDELSVQKITQLISIKKEQNGIVIMATHITPKLLGMKEFEL